MKRLIVDSREPDPAAMQEAAAILLLGGVVAYPTETSYGLAVDPRSDEAVAHLFELKERDLSSPITLVACDLAQAEEAGPFGRSERLLAAAFWPGPLTIVVPSSPALSRLLSAHRTVGVRVPADVVACALARAFGACITATSANVSGRPPAATSSEVAAALEDRIDLLIDAGPTPGGPPSTIVEVIDGVPTPLRVGAVAWGRVLESLE